MAQAAIDYEKASVSDAIGQLQVDVKTGLTSAEATKRLAQYGL